MLQHYYTKKLYFVKCFLLNSIMAYKKKILFPDYLFDGQLEVPSDLNKNIQESLKKNKESGITTETVYGWFTNKQFPCEGIIPQLANLLAKNFVGNVVNNFDLGVARDINLLNPWLISTNPNHSFPTTLEPQRWYNAGVYLQTTNKGSHLKLDNYTSKVYAGQNTQENSVYIKPKQYKVIYWPSHIPWSLTPNMSMVETTMLICTFRADAKK